MITRSIMKKILHMQIAKHPAVRKAAFSLVEVLLAIGIVSFALLTIFGLIPVGLEAMNSATQSTVQSDIMKTIYSQLESTPFSELNNFAGPGNTNFPAFFDYDGGQLRTATSKDDPGVSFIADVRLNPSRETIEPGNNGFVPQDKGQFWRGRIYIGFNKEPEFNDDGTLISRFGITARPFVLVQKGSARDEENEEETTD